MTPQEAWDATAVAGPLELGQWQELSTKPETSQAELAVSIQAGGEREAQQKAAAGVSSEPVKLSGTLRSTMMNVVWSENDLMVLSMDGELVAKFDYPFPQGMKYLSLRHATAKFQNMADPV